MGIIPFEADMHKEPYIVAAIPAGEKDNSLAFINVFVPVLSQYKRTLTLTEITFNEYDAAIRKANLLEVQWRHLASSILTKLKEDYELLIFDCGFENTQWAMFCLQQADCILIVGDATFSPRLNSLEKDLFSENSYYKEVRKYLVLLHPKSLKLYSGTVLWLHERQDVSIHHICIHEGNSLIRFARILSNKSIGLVLSGGGSNGYAHIGVLQALKEYGITIDVVGGVSMGAIIAAFYAMGNDAQDIMEFLKTMKGEMKKPWGLLPIFLLQFPLSSIINPRYMEKFYNYVFKDIQIEDLWLPFLSLACNLTTTEEVVFDRGPLLEAILATNALAGIMSPQLISGELYVDGSTSNPMPADVMKQKYAHFIIGSNMTRNKAISIDPNFQKFPSSREILCNRLNFSQKNYKIPYLLEIINATLIFANKRKLAATKKIVDCLIEPDLSQFGIQQHGKMKIIIEAGYREACVQLERLGKIGQ